jgi:hypothetical protein
VVAVDRRSLRAALLEAEPWLAETDRGPRAVDAGSCDRCRERPRLLPTCGPDGWPGLCRPCAADVGVDAWCDGHHDEAETSLRWAAALPGHWDLAVTLWWVATGEVQLDRLVRPRDLDPFPAAVRAALPDPG